MESISTTNPSQDSNSTTNSSSSGSGITTLNDAAADTVSNNSDESSSDSSSNSGGTSPLLEGDMSFEELVGEICKGIDLIFAAKRSTVVITDYESIFAEAKYLRDTNNSAVKGEDIQMWQLEEGTYELDVNQ